MVNALAGGLVTFATVGATVATVPTSIGCKSCLTMDCGATFTSTELVLSSAQVVPNARLTLCRGVECQSCVLSAAYVRQPEKHTPDTRTVGCASVMGFSCYGEVDASTGSVPLAVAVVEAAEGDVLSVTITGPDGTLVATHKGVVAYHSIEPNGPGCDPTCTAGSF